MSEDTKKTEQIEQQTKASELSEQDLGNVAGGATVSTAKSGIKTVASTPTTSPTTNPSSL